MRAWELLTLKQLLRLEEKGGGFITIAAKSLAEALLSAW